MDLLCSDGIVVRIEDISYSPYLLSLKAMSLPRDMVDGLYKIPFVSSMVREYRAFLEGEIPRMDDELEAMFDWMGHPNKLNYPLDYWAVKLHDNWMRDHLYPRRLYMDPYYDLIEVPIVNQFST